MVTTELDHYLSEDIIPRSPDFDILMWWKINGAKYPTLQEIARDFLAIPITSVASESAFSSCGRLLDPHRSRLHYSTIEAMMCTRSWIKEELKRENGVDIGALDGVFSAMTMDDPAIEELDNNGKENQQLPGDKTAFGHED
ncbi:Putative AC transposase [Linum grandiflorum]